MKMKKTYKNQLPNNIEVKSTNVRIENNNLFVDVEFKEKFVPKFGDIVKILFDDSPYERNYMICIYPDKDFVEDDHFFDLPFLTLNGRLIIDDAGGSRFYCDIVPASDSEKQELFDKLAEVGKKWNPVTKQIENIRWIPKQGEEYWFITENFNFKWTRFNKFEADDLYRADHNNCFKTEEAAKKVAKQMKEILKNSKAE